MRPLYTAVSLLALSIAPSLTRGQAPSLLERGTDSIFAAFSRTNTPGCAIGVDQDGAPVLRRAWGMANLETPVPFTIHTISESGSTAKQFVAGAVLLLVLDGVLSLGDDITKWIPEVKGIGKRITVRHILSHTSGLPDRYLLHDIEGRAAGVTNHDNREVMHVVSRLRELNFDPGEDYEYSNTAYVVAATVVERASGRSLQQFTDERIFRPLGMMSTHWREDPATVVPGRAAAYAGNASTGFENDHPFTRVIGSGGLNITIDDYMKWSGALMRGEGKWGQVRDSMSAVIRLNDGTAITYGLGVSTDMWRGVRRISHTGSTGGYRAALSQFPDQRTTVALLCNAGSANPGVLAGRVAELVLAPVLEPVRAETAPAVTTTPEAVAAIAGRYHSSRTEEVLVLVVRNGMLADSLSNVVYLPWGGNRFRARGGTTELEVLREGTKPAIRRTAPNARGNVYERVEIPDASPAALAALAGTYRSPELGATFTLTVRDGALGIDAGYRGFEPMRPLYRDGFALSGGRIARFTRDARGRVTGFVVWAGRVRHLRFDREPSPR
jgi:CubicO group peptidase (beta-lactamase class C family)